MRVGPSRPARPPYTLPTSWLCGRRQPFSAVRRTDPGEPGLAQNTCQGGNEVVRSSADGSPTSRANGGPLALFAVGPAQGGKTLAWCSHKVGTILHYHPPPPGRSAWASEPDEPEQKQKGCRLSRPRPKPGDRMGDGTRRPLRPPPANPTFETCCQRWPCVRPGPGSSRPSSSSRPCLHRAQPPEHPSVSDIMALTESGPPARRFLAALGSGSLRSWKRGDILPIDVPTWYARTKWRNVVILLACTVATAAVSDD